MRKVFFIVSLLLLGLIAWLATLSPHAHWLWLIWVVYTGIGVYDMLQRKYNVLRNYPVIGHFRYIFEFIRPEIQQYFVATNQSGRPFSREQRELVYNRAAGERDTIPFGTQQDISDIGYEFARHSIMAKSMNPEGARVTIGGPACKQPYSASRLNVSAMSFGALGKKAVLSLNAGAKICGCYHNSGEGGVSPYHLEPGGDLVMQFGTGYFGCRNKDGDFDPEMFKAMATRDNVKMVEIKISQGAKPATGGLLPAAKVTEEIAKIRGIEPHKLCESPIAHTAFSTPKGLLQFVQQLRELSGGKPVGFKLCLGKRHEFMAIVKAMVETKILPDFITIDGSEGGTGAAPVEYTNRLGVPIHDSIIYVHNCLVGADLRKDIKLIASGKVVSGFDMLRLIACGADVCNSARGMLFSLGCIQAVRCNTNTCPTGITTQDPSRMQALHVPTKAQQVARFHEATVKSFLELTGALGLSHPDELEAKHVGRVVADEAPKTYSEIFHQMQPGTLLDSTNIPEEYASHWEMASSDRF